ncbi:hypothetical protein [Polynucleobacter sp. AP-Nickl1-40-C4]|uniref:hypothetical protein n=1 Tax=Polynucleobacter sp. AP-Nickl1-40-C4 TaxID=3108275 RepID=UPI002B233547|nr:hypothetical protein [Polynucleobacter sp. AP-Nickl1-40-C4]MEA9567533.1 hypothetical protein [Polynucleobacter sp. AP-Nickl1-40-C4]
MNYLRVVAIGACACIGALLFTSCSTPEAAMPKLKQYLGAQCLEMMTAPGINGYQYISQHPAGRGVFALAMANGYQVCAYSTTREGIRDWNTLEVLALGRCEDARKAAGMNTTCKVFARGFDIVWDEKKTHGME